MGGCGTTGMPFLSKNSIIKVAMWQGALSWWSVQLLQCFVAREQLFFLVFQESHGNKLINSLSLRYKFCMDNPLTVKKADEHGFYFWLAHSRLFRTWWCRCVPFLTLSFISGSYSKIHDSSPVITFFKKFLSLWIHSRRWRHKSFRLSFCSIVRFLGTIFAHASHG